MPLLYLDTSALVRLYDMKEAGSYQVHDLCAPAGQILTISGIAQVEFASALARKARERSLNQTDRDGLWDRFLGDCSGKLRLIPVGEDLLRESASLVFKVALRALAALHVASALFISRRLTGSEPLRFVTADKPQADAASRCGLDIEWVN